MMRPACLRRDQTGTRISSGRVMSVLLFLPRTILTSRSLPIGTRIQQAVEIGDRGDWLAAEPDDHIPGPEACGRRRALRLDRHHCDGPCRLEAVLTCQGRGKQHLRRTDPEVGSSHAAVGEDLSHYERRGVRRHREADPLRRGHRRVDAGHASGGIEERSTGASGVEGRVGLDHPFDEAPTELAPQGPPEGAHDPQGHGPGEAQG